MPPAESHWTYTQAVTLHKRRAQSDVVRLFRTSGSRGGLAAIAADVPFCAFKNRLDVRDKSVFPENCTANSDPKVFLFVPTRK